MQGPKKYTNRLINETSPYLLQHAHNPVDWYPWGEEAFEKARNEDKPILLSVGYSACHWCHVMERESFEDEETARLMNENFVNIKVDMEERPDVDQIYMSFVQMTTGHGGYPMNVFLTSDKKPFFGGTYFPPVSRFNLPSFKAILTSIAEAWEKRRDELLFSANDILGEIRRLTLAEISPEGLSPELSDTAFQFLTRYFDAKNGGFGGSPKFPPSMVLEFLLRYYHRTHNENALEMVKKTCWKMAHGGLYDQLGGGFHRYTVDANWLTPHFEKMLYDNAQLIRVYLHLFQITKDEFYKRIAVETLEYVKREMLDSKGGFYTAQDADSEGVEGKFFIWTPEEVEAVLGTEQARIFCFYYDISAEGNFEGKNILNIKNSLAETAGAFHISVEKLQETLEQGRKLLFHEREKRVKPFRDEKILTAWNGLMLAAFAESAAILNSDEYLQIARQNADFLLENLQKKDRLLRTWKDGEAKLNAYLEDYANLADGLLELFQVSGDFRYFAEAKRLANLMMTEFWDEENGGFFFTSRNHEELLIRNKDFFDNAHPSGNSVAADVLLKLAKLTGDERLERFAVTVLRLVASQMRRYPMGFGRALSVLEFYFSQVKEIVVLGDPEKFKREIWRDYLPNKIVVLAKFEEDAANLPLSQDKTLFDNKPTVFICENFVCQKPVTKVEELQEQLSRR